MNKYEEALKDIRELKQNYPKSPILKDARKEEIEIAKLLNLPELEEFYKSFINEYPEEIRIKYEYALYLKKTGKKLKKQGKYLKKSL